MHKCLQINEILTLIFAELDADSYIYDPRLVAPPRIAHRDIETLRTLAGLARTCRTLSQPAVDVLWRDIPDLYILVESILLERLLHYDETKKELSLLQNPSSADWERLNPYIRRIRTVGIPVQPSGLPTSRTLDEETILRPLDAFLRCHAVDSRRPIPRLHHVVYHSFWASDYYSRILIHPQLEVLHLPMLSFSSVNAAMDDGLPIYASEPLWSLLENGTHHICSALVTLENLRTLWIRGSSWQEDAFWHLSQLPTLTTLAFESGSSSIYYPHCSEMEHNAFPALKQLFVSTANDEAPEFLDCIDPSALDAITIYWDYLYEDANSSANALEGILTSLYGIRQPRHVRVVLEDIEERMIGDPSLQPSHSRHGLQTLHDMTDFYLEHVLSQTSLCTLEIGIDVIYQVDNDFLSKLAQSLPNLESLSLVPLLKADFSLKRFVRAKSEPDKVDDLYLQWGLCRLLPTFDGLLTLVEGCARLTSLKIAMESTISAKIAPDDGTHNKLRGRLRHMELWATGLDIRLDDRVFVQFFNTYFPGLEDMRVLVPLDPYSDSDLFPLIGGSNVVTSRDGALARWETVIRDMKLEAPRPST